MGGTTTTWTPRDARALAAVGMQFAVNGAVSASFVPRLPEIRDEIDIGTGALGALMSIASLTGFLGSASVAPVVGRYGTRLVIVVAASMGSVFLTVVGFATVWPILLLGLAGMATFDVYVDVAMNMQGSWLSARRHRPVMNRLHGLWSLGGVMGGLAASVMADAGVSLRVHLVVASLVLLVLAWVLSTSLLHEDERHADAPTTPDGEITRGRSLGRGELFAAGFFAVAIEVAAVGWAAFRLTDDVAATAGLAAIAFVAVTVGMTVGRFAGDSVAHRVGAGRLLHLSTVLAAIGLAVASLVPVGALAIAGFAVAGLGAATMIPKLYDDAARMPGRAGAGLGALTAGIRLAALLVPVAVGSLAGTSLSVGQAIAVVTLPAAAGFLAVTRHVRRR
jgi:MFS family permease